MKTTIAYACITMLICAFILNVLLLRGVLVIDLPAAYKWMPILAKVVLILGAFSILGLMLLSRDSHPNKE